MSCSAKHHQTLSTQFSAYALRAQVPQRAKERARLHRGPAQGSHQPYRSGKHAVTQKLRSLLLQATSSVIWRSKHASSSSPRMATASSSRGLPSLPVGIT